MPFQHSLRSLPTPCTLRDALSTRLDLQAPLRRPVLRALSACCGDPAERAWMELLCSKTCGGETRTDNVFTGPQEREGAAEEENE